MIGNKKIVCIIPARLSSTRFPQKILTNLAGRPLLEWIWDAATATKRFAEVAFAIDSPQAASLITSFGGRYVMTSPDCPNGTARLIEVMHQGEIDGDIWVNWQGDEPFISTQVIGELLHTCDSDDADVWTLKKEITQQREISSPNVAKVVCDCDGYAIYFSRSTIPYHVQAEQANARYFKHIGIYAFTKQTLQRLAKLPYCRLEVVEQLEQERFLYHRLKVRVHETTQELFGIDTPEDLARAELHAKTLLK